ncbi:unnamed protein product (macronuclear) [Paramecium tetraurelia]|uniref:Uncharacterized protein n=1 Tax=Paramecium tetraurelia TaxID=5888 RepID=A0BXA9_PARTE|nr:uncharacterized protein GSPATT00033029001 [Paramecium tetraurelia]CAK63176.1 unnamed protein product [Paramecium tetraurelia]|eukprot:XP_001430574.1 hypothetical protein (macronuclear) [Paramecium tetraurelia strain d4-2]
MIKNLHRTVIIRTSNSRKLSTSSIDSDSTSTKSDIKFKQPIFIQQPLQPLKEVSEPNTPDALKIPQTSKIASRKSRFQKPVVQVKQDSSSSSDTSSDASEHNIWNDDEILLKGVHLGDYAYLSPTDELQMLYKVRFETYPNKKEQISEQQLALETQKLINKLKLHYLKYKKILPLENLKDYTQQYNINDDMNYMRFWDYFRVRTNHRKHKQLIMPAKNSKENKSQQPQNPTIRSQQRIKTEYRIKSLNTRKL